MRKIFLPLMLSVAFFVTSELHASGIFTLRGKLMSFTEAVYVIETKSMIYEIKRSGLNKAQIAELQAKKTGQEVDLVVSTESVASVRDAK